MSVPNHAPLLTRVLEDYLTFREASVGGSVAVFEAVLADWARVSGEIADRNRAHGTSFNPFTRIKIGETSHSKLLGDLLNPRGSHGQGTLFLDVLLGKLGCPIPESDTWKVTVETGRVDILIWRHHPVKSAIIIENKSNNAGDQPNQIYRYWHREMYLWDRELWDTEDQATVRERDMRFHIAYLPTDGGRSPAEHTTTRPVDWTGVDNPHREVPLKCMPLTLPELTGAWLSEALPRIPSTNSRLRDFLTQYHELWTR
jgi:hypothetical protein